jgi:hypothetical protein
MNVENRKLFANRDARRKLAEMGGIMASSPELLGEAQIYANGGDVQVEQYVAVIPGVNAGRPIRLTAETLSRLQSSHPEIMQQSFVIDQGTAEERGVDVMKLRPGDMFAERVLNDSGIADQAPVEAPAGPSFRDVVKDTLSQSYEIGPIEALGNQIAAQGPAGTPTTYGVPAPGEGLGVETFGQGNIFTNQGTTAGGPGIIPPESEVEKLRRQYLPSQGERPTDVDFEDPTLAGLTPAPFVAQQEAPEPTLSEVEKLRRQALPSQGERPTDVDFEDPTLAGLTPATAPKQATPPPPTPTNLESVFNERIAPIYLDPTLPPEILERNRAEFGKALRKARENQFVDPDTRKVAKSSESQKTADAASELLRNTLADEDLIMSQPVEPAEIEKTKTGPEKEQDPLIDKVEKTATSDKTTKEKNNDTAKDVLGKAGLVDPNEKLSSKEAVSKYEQLFKEMLGEDDEDASKEMWHNMAMIGFAIAAGESPRALQNIANGLLAGTKMMKEDRAAEKKREDAIKMLAIEAGLEDTRSAEKFARDKELAKIRGDSIYGKRTDPVTATLRLADTLYADGAGDYNSYEEARKAAGEIIAEEYGLIGKKDKTEDKTDKKNREAIGNELGL